MNHLLHLQDKILKTGAALARLESEVAARPESRSLQSNILSLRKLHFNLEQDFQRAAGNLGLDVCHYRMLEDRPAARVFSGAIGGFQEALSLAYESLRNGPKSRRFLSQPSLLDTELRVAYSYPGSFGVAFTIANERLLLPDVRTTLDRAASTVFDIGKAADNAAIVRAAVREIGRAPILAIYDWAKANSQYHAGAAIEWRRNDDIRGEVLIQAPEFGALSDSLEAIREVNDSEITATGLLVGADTKTRRFHFIVDNTDEDVRGRFTDAISEFQRAELPTRYLVRLQKTVEVSYATEQEKVSYLLLKLDRKLDETDETRLRF
jgi:hypothetical protein